MMWCGIQVWHPLGWWRRPVAPVQLEFAVKCSWLACCTAAHGNGFADAHLAGDDAEERLADAKANARGGSLVAGAIAQLADGDGLSERCAREAEMGDPRCAAHFDRQRRSEDATQRFTVACSIGKCRTPAMGQDTVWCKPGRRASAAASVRPRTADRAGSLFYVEVDDGATYLSKAEGLGGTTLVPPTEIPNFGFTFAFFADPEGHVVGLSKGAVQA
jgi:hypothetical protein